MRLGAGDLGGESVRLLNRLNVRLSAGDLGGEKHALVKRLSAGDLREQTHITFKTFVAFRVGNVEVCRAKSTCTVYAVHKVRI